MIFVPTVRVGETVSPELSARGIGSIPRECLDRVVAAGEAQLRRVLRRYAGYCNRASRHRSLSKDCPPHHPAQAIGKSRVSQFLADSITSTLGRTNRYTQVRAGHLQLPRRMREGNVRTGEWTRASKSQKGLADNGSCVASGTVWPAAAAATHRQASRSNRSQLDYMQLCLWLTHIRRSSVTEAKGYADNRGNEGD